MELRTRWMALLVAAAAGCTHAAALQQPAPPPPPSAAFSTTPVVLGETFGLDSKLLGEHRAINVYLPPAIARAASAIRCCTCPTAGSTRTSRISPA